MVTQLNHPKSRKIYCLILLPFILLLISGCKSGNPVPPNNTPVSQNENASAAFNLGTKDLEQKNYDKAIEEFTQAIQLDPNNAKYYNNRCTTFISSGKYDAAIEDCNTAIKLNPKYAFAYNNRGLAFYNKNEYNKAISDFSQAINLDPKYAMPYNNRGQTYEALGKHDQAIADYNQAIQLNAKSSLAYFNRGNFYIAKGEFDLAISDYSQSISINPNYVNAYIARGSVYIDKGEYRLGMKDLEFAIPLQQDPKVMWKINSLYLSIPEDKNNAINPYNMSLKSIQRKDGVVTVEFCFNLPSDTNWTIETLGGFGEVAGYQVKLITDKDTFGVVAWHGTQESKVQKKGDLKCEFIEFQPPDSVDLSNSKIIINKLVTPIPIKPDCKKVQEKIDQMHPGFVIFCDISGTGSSIGLTSGPDDISQGQAYTFLDDALHEAVVYGPWIFSAGLPK